MSDESGTAGVDALGYMVTGVDENGDTDVFVTADLARAEAKLEAVQKALSDVKANWLDPW